MPTTIVWAALCRFMCWKDLNILPVGHRIPTIKTNIVNSTTLQIKPFIVFGTRRCELARADPSRNSIFRRTLSTVGILINCIKGKGTKEKSKKLGLFPHKKKNDHKKRKLTPRIIGKTNLQHSMAIWNGHRVFP